MKKIAFISTLESVPWGGSESLWSMAALKLVKEQIDVGVNVLGWPAVPAQVKSLRDSGCDVCFRPKFTNFTQRLIRTTTGNSNYFRMRFSGWLDSFKPDLAVIAQSSNIDGCFAMEACAGSGIKYVVISQNADNIFWPPDDFIDKYRDVFLRAERCYFVSKANLDVTEMQFGVQFPKAKVIRNTFNVDYDVRVPWPKAENKFKLACVARMDSPKGQDILFRVMSQDKWRERPIAISLFGDGSNRGAFLNDIKMMRLDNIKYEGFVSDIASIWASHQMLILPSRIEGLPLAMVEAMLCGRPSIVTDVGGNTELLEDGLSGFVAACVTQKSLDDALERAWHRREEWEGMGIYASRKVREMIPRDPAGVLADELKELAGTTRR